MPAQDPQLLPPSPIADDYAIVNDDENTGLLEYWALIRRKKSTLALIAFSGALAAILFTLPQTPIYQARTSVEIQSLNENFMNMRDVNPNSPTSGATNQETDIQTQVKIFQSESLLGRVADKLNLVDKAANQQHSRTAAWRKTLNLPEPDAKPTRESVIKGLQAALKVRAQANTRLVEILVDSPDPKQAAEIANTLTTEFVQLNLESRWKTTQDTGAWLTQQMQDLKIKLEKSEEELQAYARTHNLLFTDEKQNVAEAKLQQLQEELSRAQAERIALQSKYETASETPIETLGQVLDDANLRDIQNRLTDLNRQLADLTSTLTPAHPKAKKVQAQIDVLEASLERERGRILRRIQNDFDAAQRREKHLAATYNSHTQLVSRQADEVAHYNILKREVDTNRAMYDSMLQRVKEAGVASALQASNARIVDPATAPSRPYKPSLPLNTALGLLAGGFLGVVFIVMRERADRSIQDPGDAPMYLRLAELGVIPALAADPANGKSRLLPYYRRRALPSADSENTSLIPTEPKPAPTGALEVVSWERKGCAMAESFRAALTSILFCGTNGDRPRSLVLSSANPREGKTTVTTNLAIALAQINRRIVLVDADLRKPRLHSLFDLDNTVGLSTLLLENEPLTRESIEPYLRKTEIPNLLVIPSGPYHEAASSLLHSPRTAELMKLLRANYDMVLIDTPPMLTMPDARVLGRLVDAVILVVRAHHTTRDAAIAASNRFTEDGTRVLGTILNDWNPKQSTHYYGYGHGYAKYYKDYKHYYAKKD